MARESENGTSVSPEISAGEYEMPCHTPAMNNEGVGVAAGIDPGVLHHLAPSAFSDAIDAIGMGPFQNRIILMCGMVSRALLYTAASIGFQYHGIRLTCTTITTQIVR